MENQVEIVEPSRSDLKMYEKAIAEKWEIPPTVLARLPLLMTMIATKSVHERNRMSAAKILMMMHAQNMDDGSKRGPTINVGVKVDNHNADDKRDRIREIAERVRFERTAQESAS